MKGYGKTWTECKKHGTVYLHDTISIKTYSGWKTFCLHCLVELLEKNIEPVHMIVNIGKEKEK